MSEVIPAGEQWTDAEVEAFRDFAAGNSTVPTMPGIEDVAQYVSLERTIVVEQAGTVGAMLSEARTLIGTSEHPAGSNSNFITQWYGIDGPWCDMAVSYEAAKSGNLIAMGGKFAFVPAHAQWFKNHGEWTFGNGSVRDVRPGDIVFYQWNGHRTTDADHVGVCEKNLGDGTIYSLEGNTSDVYARRHRDGTYVAGYARPKYSGGNGSGSGTDKGFDVSTLKTVKMGDNGLVVKILQVLLNDIWQEGSEAKLVVDSAFGPAVDKRVKQEQAQHGLASDGVVGPKTWALLLDA